MDSATYLLPEDQPEFERILDEALRRARSNPQFSPAGDSFDPERLRAMAVDAIGLIAPAAEAEYRRLVRQREQFGRLTERNPAAAGRSAGPADGGSRAGLAAMVAVLIPVLSGVAALVFLVFGHALRLADPEPPVAAGMRTTGWVFAAMTGAGVLAAAVVVFGTALRNGATADPAAGRAADAVARAAAELDQARAEWRRALLERGINPFLRDAVAAAGRGAGRPDVPPRESRTPRLSFTSPSFTSPAEGREPPSDGPHGEGAGYTHPHYSSPRFSSPAESDENRADRADRADR
ncbi:hypothetical protein [Streptomyces aidingensis]|uniref:Transmembrane protein n=1 Tax=Streptomyces aidingensis TaxID=910347 RepID=A0A1I1QFE5_9ACTN|nr:hypothetical protein [Streptomyces aidingensis]SFD20831.1 hypothetical protein SAMN05421773_11177 [Streptomyces aidingensis]